jgi:hypothetical protein
LESRVAPSEERFSITIGLAVTSGDSLLQVTPLSVEYSYLEMAAPPSFAGGVKRTVSVWPDAAMDAIVGAVGGAEHEPTWDATPETKEVAEVEPTAFTLVTATEIVDPTISGSSARQRVVAVAPDISDVTPLFVRFHWIVVDEMSSPPVFQVPSSIVNVVPVVAAPKIVGSPVFCGAVAAARI